MPTVTDHTEPSFPLSGVAKDGWSTDTEATATCFCGAVQLSFPTQAPGFVDSFVCNCHDCRKVTASMFASNFIIDNAYLTHVRGRESLKSWGQDVTPASGNKMTNYFCGTCGTLMYRVSSGAADQSFLRIGTVDDFTLHETKLRPRTEQFVEGRVSWFHGVDGARQVQGNVYGKARE